MILNRYTEQKRSKCWTGCKNQTECSSLMTDFIESIFKSFIKSLLHSDINYLYSFRLFIFDCISYRSGYVPNGKWINRDRRDWGLFPMRLIKRGKTLNTSPSVIAFGTSRSRPTTGISDSIRRSALTWKRNFCRGVVNSFYPSEIWFYTVFRTR